MAWYVPFLAAKWEEGTGLLVREPYSDLHHVALRRSTATSRCRLRLVRKVLSILRNPA